MALGRRRHRSERQKIDATPPWSTDRERDTELTTGPYDQDDAPDDGLERLDLGALLVPVMRGVEVRVDVGPDGQVVAATLSYGGSEAQIGVFAAPRTAGIWDEVRKEIRALPPERVAQYLARNGYEPINVAGGMLAWAEAGRQVVTDSRAPGTV